VGGRHRGLGELAVADRHPECQSYSAINLKGNHITSRYAILALSDVSIFRKIIARPVHRPSQGVGSWHQGASSMKRIHIHRCSIKGNHITSRYAILAVADVSIFTKIIARRVHRRGGLVRRNRSAGV
jgi:hypothetical protein